MNDISTMTAGEMERQIGSITRQLDSLAAQQTGIRRAIQNGRGSDAMRQQQSAVEAKIKALRTEKQLLQSALTNKRKPAPSVPPETKERFDVTAGLAAARQRERQRG